MLEATLNTKFVPASNLKGDVSGANWSFLLPRMELERTLCFGVPPETTLTTLARISREVLVACESSKRLERFAGLYRTIDSDRVQSLLVTQPSDLAFPDDSLDLIVLTDRTSVRRMVRNAALLATCRRLLRPEGLIYFEFQGPKRLLLNRKLQRRLSEAFGAMDRLWLTPQHGEMHTAVPHGDRETIAYFLDRGFQSATLTREAFRRVLQRLSGGGRASEHRDADGTRSVPATLGGKRRAGLQIPGEEQVDESDLAGQAGSLPYGPRPAVQKPRTPSAVEHDLLARNSEKTKGKLAGAAAVSGLPDGIDQFFMQSQREREMQSQRAVQSQRTRRSPGGAAGAKKARSLTKRIGQKVLQVCDRLEAFGNRHLAGALGRSGMFVSRPVGRLTYGPPQYLRSIAQSAGINVDSYRWGLAAGGEYSSRKLLFFLFDRDSHTFEPPEYIVKLTRHPEFNGRLQREVRALTMLHEQGIGHRDVLPEVVFAAEHGGLAVVGETMVGGVPFDQRTRFTADCRAAANAVDWLTELGAATSNSLAVTPDGVAEAMTRLLAQFIEIYSITTEQRTFLTEQIASIGESKQPLPVVFQHGDPGRWNVLVTGSGRAAFLDWESAEPQGMPLWDLLHFLRSYCVGGARSRGPCDALDGFAEQFLSESPLSRMAVEAVARYCEKTDVPGHFVEPLFYTCWMHRALKEATRLTPQNLQTGHYVSLLRLCIDHRELPTLKKLFRLPSYV